MIKYEKLDDGFVHQCPNEGPDCVAVTSRSVVTREGEILCSFHLQSGIGMNNFAPCLSRSNDGGKTWQLQGKIWPHLREKYSINCSISKAANGDLFLYGFRMPRKGEDESFWSEETLGILPNELIWSRSTDSGHTWSEPEAFSLPLPGAAETPTPICVTRAGRWIAPYAPHNTFDPNLEVDLRHTVIMISDDEGATWRHQSIMRVEGENTCIAASWVAELANGALLCTCCHLTRGKGDDYPNPFTMSFDGGDTWLPTGSTGIMGQVEGLAPWGDNQALFVYNQRRCETPGIWLAVAEPSAAGFGVKNNAIAWQAGTVTRAPGSVEFSNWTNYSFGEPCVTVLPDQTVLIVFWCIQPQGRGVGFVKLKIV
jgi:hypothetical protein